MKYLPLVGRILFSIIFISSGLSHIFMLSQMSQYTASMGVPAPTLVTLLTGIMLLVGGFSILLGYKIKIGAIVLVVFLLPATFIAHNFWALTDPMQKQMQMIMFMKNLGLLGGALMLYYFGSGPLSLDKNNSK